jgi:hypothetical protein
VIKVITAQANTKTSSTLKMHQSKRKKAWSVWSKIISVLAILLHRLWWHTKGYGTVVAMMGLVLMSMVYLYLNSLSTKFFKYQVQDDLKNF